MSTQHINIILTPQGILLASLLLLLSGCQEPDHTTTYRPTSALSVQNVQAQSIQVQNAQVPNVQAQSANTQSASQPRQAGDLSTLVVSLHQRLNQSTPNDIGGWVLLSQTYKALNQSGKAMDALHQGLKNNPKHPRLLAVLERMANAGPGMPAPKRRQNSPLLSPGLKQLMHQTVNRANTAG